MPINPRGTFPYCVVNSVFILLVCLVTHCCYVAAVVEAAQGGLRPDESRKAAEGAPEGAKSGPPPASKTRSLLAAEEDGIKAAALHCVALDDAGKFPADRVLGLFEVAPALGHQTCDSRHHQPPSPPRQGKLKHISDARVDFVVRRQQYSPTDEGDGDEAGSAPEAADVVSVTLVIALEAGPSSGERTAGEYSPSSADVEEAVAGAVAAVGVDRAGANGAIAALACWNLRSSVTGEEEKEEEEVDDMTTAIRVELIAAFGDKGDWFTAEKTVVLTRDSAPQRRASVTPSLHGDYDPGSSSNGVQVLRASFDWTPTRDIWDAIDGAVVADVRVYDATAGNAGVAIPQTVGSWTGVPSLQHLLLLQASLCKKRMPWVWESGMKRTLQADVTPHLEQPAHTRRHACRHKQDTLELIASVLSPELATATTTTTTTAATATSWVVSEMDDPEWTALEENERRRTAREALNALPRWSGWTPGMWKKRRQRRRKQEEEKERRRAREVAKRREIDRAKRGGGGVAVGSKEEGRGLDRGYGGPGEEFFVEDKSALEHEVFSSVSRDAKCSARKRLWAPLTKTSDEKMSA